MIGKIGRGRSFDGASADGWPIKSREPQPRASAELHTGAKWTINAGDRVLSIPGLDRLDELQPKTKMSRDNGKSESFSCPIQFCCLEVPIRRWPVGLKTPNAENGLQHRRLV